MFGVLTVARWYNTSGTTRTCVAVRGSGQGSCRCDGSTVCAVTEGGSQLGEEGLERLHWCVVQRHLHGGDGAGGVGFGEWCSGEEGDAEGALGDACGVQLEGGAQWDDEGGLEGKDEPWWPFCGCDTRDVGLFELLGGLGTSCVAAKAVEDHLCDVVIDGLTTAAAQHLGDQRGRCCIAHASHY